MTSRFLRVFEGGIELVVILQPSASANRVVGEHDGHLKIQVTAPPTDLKANEALITFLAKALRVSQRNIQLISGTTSRRKRLRIQEIDADTVFKTLVS